MLECLETDFSLCGEDLDSLAGFSIKLHEIQQSFPLEFNNYREKLYEMRDRVNKKLIENGGEDLTVSTDEIIVPDFYMMHRGDANRWIRAYVPVVTMSNNSLYSDTVDEGYAILTYSFRDGVVFPNETTVEANDEIRVIVSFGPRMPIGWKIVPDIAKSYGQDVPGGNIEDTHMYRHLSGLKHARGFKPVIEIIEAPEGYESKFNLIISQDPQPGVALRIGEEIKITIMQGTGEKIIINDDWNEE